MADVALPTQPGTDPAQLQQAQAIRNIVAAQASAAATRAASNFVPRYSGPAPVVNPAIQPPPDAAPAFVPRFANPAQQGTTVGGAGGITPIAATPVAAPIINALAGTGTPPGAVSPALGAANIAGNGAGGVVPLPSDNGVSPTPGAGNPLPPGLRAANTDAGVPLPGGAVANVAGSTAAALRANAPQFGAPAFSSGAPVAAAPNQIGPNDLEVIRGSNSQVYQGFNGPAGGAAGGGYAGGGTGLQDPTGAIGFGFGQQEARGYRTLQSALDYINQGSDIFDRATRGRAISGILPTAFGPNNQGAVEGQGIDALNGAVGGVTQSGIQASAQEYDTGLNTAAVQEDTALNAATQKQVEAARIRATPTTISTDFVTPRDANGKQTGLPVARPVLGFPQVSDDLNVLGARPIRADGSLGGRALPKEGDTTSLNGVTYTYKNGKFQ